MLKTYIIAYASLIGASELFNCYFIRVPSGPAKQTDQIMVWPLRKPLSFTHRVLLSFHIYDVDD